MTSAPHPERPLCLPPTRPRINQLLKTAQNSTCPLAGAAAGILFVILFERERASSENRCSERMIWALPPASGSDSDLPGTGWDAEFTCFLQDICGAVWSLVPSCSLGLKVALGNGKGPNPMRHRASEAPGWGATPEPTGSSCSRSWLRHGTHLEAVSWPGFDHSSVSPHCSLPQGSQGTPVSISHS